MRRTGYFIVLFLSAILVYFVGGYWAGIPEGVRTAIKIALPVLLAAFTITCKRSQSLQRWHRVALSLFVASVGFLVSWMLIDYLLAAFAVSPETVSGIALTKLFDALLIVIPVLLVARMGGLTSADLYLRRGRLKTWLFIGMISFVGFAALFLLQVLDQGVTAGQLLAWAPWTIMFIFSNAFMEELHFRGLLLRPFESVLGKHLANLCIALFFTVTHAPVSYTSDIFVFLAILFALSLVWGYLIQRTESLWGSVIFHAGADLLVVVGIYQTYGAV